MRSILKAAVLCLVSLFAVDGHVAEIYQTKSENFGNYTGCNLHLLHIYGQISVGDQEKLEKIIKQLHAKYGENECKASILDVRVISSGGDVETALALGRLIRKTELRIIVPYDSICSSSCVFLLAAGVKRTVVGKVGIHRPYFSALDYGETYKSVQLKRERLAETIKNYLHEVDVSTALYEAMVAVPPESIRYLTDSEVAAFRLSGDDAAYEERNVATNAYMIGVDSATYRQLRQASKVQCKSLDMDCHDSVMFGVSTKEAESINDDIIDKCFNLPSGSQYIECYRQVVTRAMSKARTP
jgi:ATP-dependent protease ClpP protease subunit